MHHKSTPTRKGKKRYPMDGPSPALQKLMQFPMRNKHLIRQGIRRESITRPETLTLLRR